MLGSACRRLRAGEDGLTIIEVMVAMVVLLFGILGTLILVQAGAKSTVKTSVREQGTNIARDLVERSRQASYTNMTMALAPATLRATLPAGEVSALSGSTFTVTRRNAVYTVSVLACSIDDPTDGIGVGDTTFCGVTATPPHPGDPPLPPPTGPNIRGITVTLGGSLLQTVCNALDLNSALVTWVTSVISPVVGLSICPPGSTTPSARVDGQADDLRQVRISVSWSRDSTGSVSQTTLLTNPLQN